jgi:plasmid maintenance system antidote protein VapI
MENEEIHLGELIKSKVQERGMSIIDFADAICCSRAKVYNHIFKCETLDIQLLKRISTVLDYDFVAQFNLRQPKYLLILEVDDLNLERFLSSEQMVFFKKIAE